MQGQFPVTKQEMVTRLAAREVLVLATEDDYFSRSNREVIDGAIRAYHGKTRFSMESFEFFGAHTGEAIPGPGPCNTYTRKILWFLRMNYRKKIT